MFGILATTEGNMNITTTLFFSVAMISCSLGAQAIIISPQEAPSTSNYSFSGHITNVSVASWGSWIENGDIGVGSTLDCNFEIYDSGETDTEKSLYAEYTFHGYTRNYKFSLDAGPFSTWSDLTIDSDGILTVDFLNGFDSDGLDSTFNDVFGGDSGYFGIVLEDYNKDTINGSGQFYWDAVSVDFVIYPAKLVNEPEPLRIMILGILALSIRRIINTQRTFFNIYQKNS